MSDSFDDELARRLASLESGSDSARMPGAAAARRRAAQRTRHQIATGVVGGVAVIAIGVLGVTQPTYTTAPDPVGPPAGTSTPTAVPTTPTQSPTTQPPTDPTGTPSGADDDTPGPDDPDGGGSGSGDTTTVLPEAFLTTADIADAGTEWAEVDADGTWLPCVPRMPENTQARSFESSARSSGTERRIDQFIEATAADQGRARLESIRRNVRECVDSGQESSLVYEMSLGGVGDEGYLLVYSGPPSTDETVTYVTVSLVRSGDHVVSVFDGGPGQDYNTAPSPDRAVTAADRLCGVLGTDCTGEPERELLYPAPDGQTPGWPGVDEVATASGLEQIAQAGDVTDPTEDGPGGWGFAGLPRDPESDGVESMEGRSYFDPDDPGIAVTETIARFPDGAAARLHFDELVAAADAFEQDGTRVTRTGRVERDSYLGATWRSEDTEYGTVFDYGVVLDGTAVAVVTTGAGDVDADQMGELLHVAGQALAE